MCTIGPVNYGPPYYYLQLENDQSLIQYRQPHGKQRGQVNKLLLIIGGTTDGLGHDYYITGGHRKWSPVVLLLKIGLYMLV